MLPIIPFEVLVPLTVLATVLCLGAIATILVRRAALRWWTRDGTRLVEQATSLILEARENGRTGESLVGWLGRGTAPKIDGLVRAADAMDRGEGEVHAWIRATVVPARLADIVANGANGTNGANGKRPHRRRERWTRVAAARALGRFRVPDTMPALARAMDDSDAEIGYAAADALSRIDLPAAGDLLLDRISERPRLNNSRIAALVESMTCDLTEVFRKHLSREDNQALFWTVTLIGQKAVFDLVVEVRPLLEAADPNVRAAACECVGELKIPMTDRWLLPLLRDEAWFVQSHAAKSLGEMRPAWAVNDLVELLYSREWWLRFNAADALVKIGAEAAEAVEGVLWSDDRFARHAAVEVLERVGWLARMVERAACGDGRAEPSLRQFGASGGLGYLENAIFTAPAGAVPLLLELLGELGDDATYGRLRAASEAMLESFRSQALAVAEEVRSR